MPVKYISKRILHFLLMIVLVVLGQGNAFAQDTATSQSVSTSETLLLVVIGLVLVVAVLILIVALYLVNIVKIIIKNEQKKEAEAKGVEYEEEPSESLFASLNKKLTDAVPIEEEESILLDHNYDGIRELDNHLPPWWKGLFYITIIISVVYMAVYHVFDSAPLMHEEYEISLAQAAEAKAARMALMANSMDETNVEITNDAGDLAKGEEIYKSECVACHGQLGEGGIGPNFTDEYWIHGGDIKDLFKTIKYGVPAKGMISWESKLGTADMRNVASFILTLQGTNPPNAKAPQGEKYVPADAAVDSVSTAPANVETAGAETVVNDSAAVAQ